MKKPYRVPMKPTRSALLALFLLIVCALTGPATSTPVRAEETPPQFKEGFESLRWGMSREDVKRLFPTKDAAENRREWLGRQAHFEFTYTPDGRLYQIRIVLEDKDTSGYFDFYKDQLIPVLVDHYGPKASSLNDVGRYTTFWRTTESVIVANYYAAGYENDKVQGQLKEPTVTLTLVCKELFALARPHAGQQK